jgi:hypothetical protein
MDKSSRRVPLKSLALGAVSALSLGMLPQAASANIGGNTYNVDVTYTASSLTCGFYVTYEACGLFQPFQNQQAGLAGDQYNVNVSGDLLRIPHSNGPHFAFVVLGDTITVPGEGAPGSNSAIVSMTLNDYHGPSNLYGQTPHQTDWNQGYAAATGFFGVPPPSNKGFSITGADATFNLLSSDPNPLTGIYFADYVTLPASSKFVKALQGGPLSNPVLLPAGMTGSITGDISGADAPQDYYGFDWSGGVFQTTATITAANPLATFSFDLTGLSNSVSESLTLDSSNGFSQLMSLDLPAGEYEIGLQTTSPYDPHYTLVFNTPVGAVPEPSSWGLMLLGVGGLGAMMRVRRRPLTA